MSGHNPRNLLVAIVFALFIIFIFHRQYGQFLKSSEGGHPIELLFERAVKAQDKFVMRQSQTLPEARSHYKSRNKVDPPLGFDKWFVTAQEWNSSVIDDFDSIHDQLRPFQHYLSNRFDLNLTREDVDTLSTGRIVQLCFRNGTVEFQGYQEGWFVEALRKMVADFAGEIADICVLVQYA